MNYIANFCLTFAVGTVGYFIFRLIRMPNPALLGSMFTTGALNVAGLYPLFPTWLVSFLANVIIGIMLGRQIDKNVISRIGSLAKYVLLQVVWLVTLSLVCGYVLYILTDVSLKTALISGTAGGITEMIVFGMSVDADVAVIAFIQVFRVVTFLALIPYISVLSARFQNKCTQKTAALTNTTLDGFQKFDYVVLVIFSLLGAWLGDVLSIPAGTMLGAMIASGLYALFLNRQYNYDPRMRFVAQIALGLVLGGRMTPAIVGQLKYMFLPGLLVTIVMLVGCIALGFTLHWRTGWDLTTCLLCCAPAGLSQIVVFAEEIEADSFTASVFHTARIIGIVIVYPMIIMPLMN